MPCHWRVVSDNAAAETKNNQFLKYLAVQVGRRNVSSAVMCQGRVGHTHNRQDASFGQVASALCRAKELECPEDFKERVEACLPDYQVEILNASWDFKAWLAPLTIKVTGLNQTQKATEKRLEACHCFKLVRRETLPPELSQLVETPGFLQTVAPHGQDVILCTKLYVASPTLSQPPLLFLPWQELAKVPEARKRNSWKLRIWWWSGGTARPTFTSQSWWLGGSFYCLTYTQESPGFAGLSESDCPTALGCTQLAEGGARKQRGAPGIVNSSPLLREWAAVDALSSLGPTGCTEATDESWANGLMRQLGTCPPLLKQGKGGRSVSFVQTLHDFTCCVFNVLFLRLRTIRGSPPPHGSCRFWTGFSNRSQLMHCWRAWHSLISKLWILGLPFLRRWPLLWSSRKKHHVDPKLLVILRCRVHLLALRCWRKVRHLAAKPLQLNLLNQSAACAKNRIQKKEQWQHLLLKLNLKLPKKVQAKLLRRQKGEAKGEARTKLKGQQLTLSLLLLVNLPRPLSRPFPQMVLQSLLAKSVVVRSLCHLVLSLVAPNAITTLKSDAPRADQKLDWWRSLRRSGVGRLQLQRPQIDLLRLACHLFVSKSSWLWSCSLKFSWNFKATRCFHDLILSLKSGGVSKFLSLDSSCFRLASGNVYDGCT